MGRAFVPPPPTKYGRAVQAKPAAARPVPPPPATPRAVPPSRPAAPNPFPPHAAIRQPKAPAPPTQSMRAPAAAQAKSGRPGAGPKPPAAPRLSPPPPSSAAAPRHAYVLQRVVYANMNALLAAATNQPVGTIAAAVAGYDGTVRALFTEANAVVPLVDAVGQAGVADIAHVTPRAAPAPGGPLYDMVYEQPPNNANDVTWSILHELIHVSGARHYTGPANVPAGRAQGAPDWALNLQLPANATNAQYDAQLATLQTNIVDAMHVVEHDGGLTQAQIDHLSAGIGARLPRAGVVQHQEYDAVISDCLLYLQQQGRTNTDSFRFLRRLVKEASDRRLVGPWFATHKDARRVERNASWYQFWKW